MTCRLYASDQYGYRGYDWETGQEGADTYRIHPWELIAGALPRLGIDTRTVPVPRDALTAGRGAVVTNAAVGLRPVTSVDGVALADASAFLDALRTAYDAIPGQPL